MQYLPVFPRPGGVHEFGAWWGLSLMSGHVWGYAKDVKYMPIDVRYSYELEHNGVIESLRKNQDKIKFIQVRHEESAAFAACGYAKVTGRLGVCLSDLRTWCDSSSKWSL